MSIELAQFSALVGGKAVAIRGTAVLEPAGGPGDKVFPPSHFVDDKNPKSGAKYAFETRPVDGESVRCVLIDSVQSLANRIEEALQSLWQQKRIRLPVITVDFTSASGISDLGRTITSLAAPHRIADALLRNCISRCAIDPSGAVGSFSEWQHPEEVGPFSRKSRDGLRD